MSGRQAEMLREVWEAVKSDGGAVVIERAADTSQFLTKIEARHLLSQIPNALPSPREIADLRAQVAILSGQVSSESTALLAAPASNGEMVDATARRVIDGIITQFESLDRRLSRVESVLETLGAVAEMKASQAA
jgi:hypothetical protein